MPKKRVVVTRSGRNMRGYYPSIKTSEMVAFESPLEKDACRIFDLCPTVVSFSAYQQCEAYYDGAELKICYPDYLLELTNGVMQLIEVKSSIALAKPRIKRKYTLIAKHFANQRRPYRIFTDTQIRSEPRFSNLKLIAYHRPRFDDPVKTPSPDLLHACNGKSFADASVLAGGDRETLRWLASGHLHIRHDQPLCDTTIVYNTQGAQHDALYF